MGHIGPRAMLTKLRMWWHPKMSDFCHAHCRDCNICQLHNLPPTLRPLPGSFDPPTWPGVELVRYFTDMITPVQGKPYLLVFVNTFSRWPEAYPCAGEDAMSVMKALVNHWIPTHGFPALIRSDNGTHFTSTHLATVEKWLGLTHKFGCVYHPASQGSVERMNRTLKEKLAKICTSSGMDCVQALPLALMSVRQTVSHPTGFSPYELLTGRLMPGPSSSLQPLEEGAVSPRFSHKLFWTQLHSFASQIQDTLPIPPPALDFPEWSSVYLKRLSRKLSQPVGLAPTRGLLVPPKLSAWRKKELSCFIILCFALLQTLNCTFVLLFVVVLLTMIPTDGPIAFQTKRGRGGNL
ncbi:dual adapter for phosphotyrosine and 3-phosphotyrosine and 3-phosphoinositide isoform X1 [Syngnathoides biaculeatus]|uniref:dual adapter for phosphotyrosine and 3-phosphotyrosine and 3-phosphoinositide isoform X1 n=1 Tax=Syngnathoides biaculeatus TaxID=300417 RepID=UPI002ADE5D0A|nr:dual adapter for phosphotyrosine and 3-phosphotyrosine and 3-phosphoinositide isoform X1 [Syngnathoides biaculeatus]XP_061700172.1 dual adapter for phosphotyrosine and 3-phosphotyrosine and 3-phosphoinositide isoform X1 [Syngnathoides biaculeatus]XP_061700173.1 dual adapter for phosphotyrosine and 3-phosphotyrosine and 3-phosphoinositide isoform X1 [Syngnathoides biaculeatus]